MEKVFHFFIYIYISRLCWVDEGERIEEKILNDWNISKNIGHGMENLFFFLFEEGRKKSLRKEKAHENLKSCCKKDIIMKTIQAWTIGLWRDEKLTWVKIMTFKLFRILEEEEANRKWMLFLDGKSMALWFDFFLGNC